MTIIIANKYEIIKKIGEGSFGNIFYGKNILTNENIAIKIDDLEDKIILKNEAKIYSLLKKIEGIPKMRLYGKEGKFNYLVMDLLDKSLEQYKCNNEDKIPLNIVINLGIQMFKRIKDVHNMNIIHRDIKPDNFVMKSSKDNFLFLIDFGLSKLYMKNNIHIECFENRKLIGTVKYVSLNIHNGLTPSRRDDLESIIYILIYLLIGNLPWEDIKSDNKEEKNKLIKECKKEYDFSKLSELPGEFILILNYIRELKFEEKPNYCYIQTLLYNLYNHKGYNLNELYI